MQGSQSSRQSRCQHHDFRLYPTNDSIYNAQYYNVSFCTCKIDRPPRKHHKIQKYAKNLTFPKFNKDANFSTPAFILNSERNYYESEGGKMKLEHQRKMEGYTEEKFEINIPKPRSKNNYCSVCKGSYEDYLDHINSQTHKRRIHQSSFNRDILELGMRYQKEQRRLRRGRNKMQRNLSTRIEDSDQVEIVQNPYRMMRANQEFQQVHMQQMQQMKQMQEMQQGYLNGLRANPGITIPLNIQGLNMGGPLMPTQNSTFKPFSTTYTQQMNQFILNLNIFFNPYPIGGLPNINVVPTTPYEALYRTKQQLSLLQYSLFNQCNHMQQLNMQMQLQQHLTSHPAHPAPSPTPPSGGRQPTCIVIDQ